MEPPAHPGDPCVVVIFGASGDLTHRKLIPALHNLATQGLLPQQFAVLGVSRSERTDAQFRQDLTPDDAELRDPTARDAWKWLSERIFYLAGDAQRQDTFQRLKDK